MQTVTATDLKPFHVKNLNAAKIWARNNRFGAVVLPNASAAAEFIDYLSEKGWSGLLSDDGVTVEFGR